MSFKKKLLFVSSFLALVILAVSFFRFSDPVLCSGVALVARQQKILLLESYGFANQEKKIKNTPETRFLIGSLTKLMTAAAIFQLVDAGEIDISLPVATYLTPEDEVWEGKMPSWAQEVTLQDLLTHSDGLPSYVQKEGFQTFYEELHSPSELIQFFCHDPLEFKPGTQYAYNGSGYNVLGVVIERVSGASYATYLRDKFFIPLRMTSTQATAPARLSTVMQQEPSLATGYIVQEGGVLQSTDKSGGEVNLSTAYAEAGVISTAADLHRWIEALFNGKIITPASLECMTHPFFQASGTVWAGAGFYIDCQIPDRPVYFHTGRIRGFDSILIYEPTKQINVILLSNQMEGNTFEVGSTLFDQAWEQK